MIALTNADIYTGDDVLFDHALVIEKEMIKALVPIGELPAKADLVDLGGACVAPGLVDLQVNGGGDTLLNHDPSLEAIERIARAHRALGTTNLMPALITTDDEQVEQAISSAKAAIAAGESGLIGLHLEGPFLNPKKAGVHDASLMRRLTLDDAKRLVDLRGDLRILLTLAPEMADEDALELLASSGFTLSAGHTAATFHEASLGAALGIRMTTHLFNAMSAMESREPGMVGAALAEDRISCGVIADGHHVHFASLRAAWHAKPRGTMFLVTDAMPPVGGNKNSFTIGKHEITVSDGKALTADGVLGGSVLDMATAVRNAVQKVGVPRDEALRMASTYPAQIVGLGDSLGRIAPGYVANLIVFDREIHIRGVVFQGDVQFT